MDRYEGYFTWLLGLVYPEGELEEHVRFNQIAFSTEFVSIVDYDENREADGVRLRSDYKGVTPKGVGTVLETIIGVAHRCEMMTYENHEDDGVLLGYWYNELLDNLRVGELDEEFIIDRFLTRTYTRNGVGSLFPITSNSEDLRYLEIWDQMMLYFNEYFDLF